MLLSDSTEMQKQKAVLDDMNERRKQLEMMAKWRDELLQQEAAEFDMVSNLFLQSVGAPISDYDKPNVLRAIREFGVNEVYEAATIAINQYCRSKDEGARIRQAGYAVTKIGGICANRRRGKFDGY